MTDTTDNTSPTTRAVSSICASLGLMSTDEMSGVLHVSPQTLATWRCKKKGPPSIKLGKKVFYLISDFSRWTQEQAKAQQGWRAAPFPNPHSNPPLPSQAHTFRPPPSPNSFEDF